MKKIVLASILTIGACFGINLDTSKTQMYWEAYKLINKTPVKGSFSDVQYKFSKKSGISGSLLGATAKIDLSKVVTGNPVSEENLTNSFFKKFEGKDIKVKIEQVIEGEDKGTILAKITMNKKSQLVPMQYEIKEGQLIAKGIFDVLSFKLDGALKQLAKACQDFHEGYTWSQVEVGFIIPVQQ
ncbi:YceI family protein [Helicobacter kayseriensis]|uniref:YceI family protein n=1 Tax=Helicobacter kayseriensis TaxID=2905877 RepID=UPI001E40E99A|nr:YceI family protein [Helicobacter kayseriensis]MCE3047170.1 YceI family protein [Helicobacter kayseriensis]MCE3048541.1 YceI family protein [Helicobacter kayseriensis]